MKCLLTLNILLLSLGLSSCEKADELTKFDLEFNTTTTIPSTATIGLGFDLLTPPVESNTDTEFAGHGTDRDHIEDIKLKTLDLTILSPDGSNFDFLESISLFIKADGLDEIELASRSDIPNGLGTKLSLQTSNSDLQAYLKSPSFTLRVNTVTDELITEDHDINIYTVFSVNATLLK